MTETIPGCPHGTKAEQGWCVQCEAGLPGDQTPQYPAGEYAIVELFGHTKLIGRIEEIDRFGSKMLQIEPLFNGQMLAPVLHGGGSIYRLVPCDAVTAFKHQPTHSYQLPPTVLAIVPLTALPASEDHQTERPYYALDEDEC
jgi:hypothetical protein